MSVYKTAGQLETNSRDKMILVRGGREYFDLLIRLINEAKETIHLQTYIYDDDETGQLVAAALKAAVARHVSVYLMADGYASQVMSQHFIDDLRNAGIEFRFFEPLLRSKYFYFGRRLHHKIFVADASVSLVGGINISNRYNDMPAKKAWLDFAVYAEGDISVQLCVLCWKTWNGFPVGMGITPCEKKIRLVDGTIMKPAKVKMLRNDWVRRKKEISQAYQDMFNSAQSSITILCSYFLPGKAVRRLLSKAVRRGVEIVVITAGPSDVMMAKHAERWLYDWLLRNKIRLYEYQPAVLHAKLAVCDNQWLTVGSYNINNISAYASIELNLQIRDEELVMSTRNTLQSILQNDCLLITLDEHTRHKNMGKQFIRWFSYQFIRSVFYILTFYYKQRD